MSQELIRVDGRSVHQLRPITVTYNAFGYAAGSVLFALGNTKVLCSVSIAQGVPSFLKGKKTGWLHAEYALLPTSTQVRIQRDSHTPKPNGRAIEISRLIGRVLRMVVDLDAIGERTITVDCDVLQADGGTRTACITASYLALRQAVAHWNARGDLEHSILKDELAAISVGLKGDQVLLDIDYQEDSEIDADYNFVITRSGIIVEVQGSLERGALHWWQFNQMCQRAQQGIDQIFSTIDAFKIPDVAPLIHPAKKDSYTPVNKPKKQDTKTPMFSLRNRISALER